MSKRKTPILRFKGFNNAWEQRKLGDIATPIKTYSLTRAFETLKNTNFKYIHYGDIHTGKAKIIQNPSTLPTIKKNDNYITLKTNDIIIADASEDYKGIADAAILKDCGNYKIVAGLHTIAIRPNSCNVSSFIYILLGRDDFKHWGYKVGTGLKVFGITLKNFLKYKTFYPSLNEQKAISNLLNLVDNLLDLQKRKYKELKLLKKALLQNILTFNSVYPNLRFKNFNSKWRKNKLGELCIYKNGTGHEGKQSSKGKFELVNLNSISIGGGLKSSGKYINSAKNTLNKNDIVMILSDIAHGNLLGKVALIPINNKYVLNQRIALLRIRRNNILPNFLFYRINSLQRYFKIKGNGTSQLNISKSDIINFEISYPNKIKEQFKISSVLKINQKFVNEIYKKEKNLKKIKQFLLQNMFI